MFHEAVETRRVQTMQGIVGRVTLCLSPKSKRKSWEIFKQVVAEEGRRKGTWSDLHCKKITLQSVQNRLVVWKKGGRGMGAVRVESKCRPISRLLQHPLKRSWKLGPRCWRQKKGDRLSTYLNKPKGLDLRNERKETLNSSEPYDFVCKTGQLIIHLHNLSQSSMVGTWNNVNFTNLT